MKKTIYSICILSLIFFLSKTLTAQAVIDVETGAVFTGLNKNKSNQLALEMVPEWVLTLYSSAFKPTQRLQPRVRFHSKLNKVVPKIFPA